MVLFHLSPALEATLQSLTSRLPSELAESVLLALSQSEDTPLEPSPEEERTISHDILVKIAKWASQDAKEEYEQGKWTLATLLSQTQVYAPPLKVPEKSPELIALLSSIQLSNDLASYAQMTSLTTSAHQSLLPLRDVHEPSRPSTVAEEWTQVRRELSAIVNVLASMMAVGTAVWWVGGGRSYAARLSLAMSGSVAIAAIESFLYYRFFTRGERTGPKGRLRTKEGGRAGVAPSILQFEPTLPMESIKSTL